MQKEEGINAKSGCPATDYNWYNARKSQSHATVRPTDGNFFNQFVTVFMHFLIRFSSTDPAESFDTTGPRCPPIHLNAICLELTWFSLYWIASILPLSSVYVR